MTAFHVEICREGPFWRLHIVEVDQYARVDCRADVDETARRLIMIHAQPADGTVDLVVWTERDSVKIVAEGLGYRRQVSTEARTDCFSRGDDIVSVRYDDYECVANVYASNELTPFQPTREGAVDALEYRPGG